MVTNGAICINCSHVEPMVLTQIHQLYSVVQFSTTTMWANNLEAQCCFNKLSRFWPLKKKQKFDDSHRKIGSYYTESLDLEKISFLPLLRVSVDGKWQGKLFAFETFFLWRLKLFFSPRLDDFFPQLFLAKKIMRIPIRSANFTLYISYPTPSDIELDCY